MAKIYQTPGVYLEEKNTFPNSVVAVATAVPAFVGYTEKAERGRQSLLLEPTRIVSYAEFHQWFGGAAPTKFTVGDAEEPKAPYRLTIAESYFTLHQQMKLFFANGGTNCYVVSVGGYLNLDGTPNAIDLDVLKTGIAPLEQVLEPTLLVIPEAAHAPVAPATLDDDIQRIGSLYQAMLQHCGGKMQSRFAIIDVWMNPDTFTREDYDLAADVTRFRDGIGNNHRQWGAAYYPWLQTTALDLADVGPKNIANLGTISDLQPFPEGAFNDAGELVDMAQFKADFVDREVTSLLVLLDVAMNQAVLNGETEPASATTLKNTLLTDLAKADLADAAALRTIHQGLLAGSPVYKAVFQDLRGRLNLLPPSAALAGVYSRVDQEMGVFQSPANVGLALVITPALTISSDQQEDLNLPLNGKAVNAIRIFPGRGTIVWGARTLAGNSQDWRYINVRRTVIFLEQSIKAATAAYVFEPNTASTWSTVEAIITNFLTNEWRAGALAGATPEDAFSVDVGLGSTMTPADIQDGFLRITVKVAITRPAEFIILTFTQQMQSS
ncbi:MAG: phage tail sheath C-terminal domain-containing protein [Bacteroidota bacterium]